ncbi:ATP-binding protein [Halarchaeum sp. P4]|uniref:sensor histidine kinase n=1 Tax=Halarchaeum sp. P4 TaxID=3421639 RepID=UPI003EBD639C
MSAFRRLFGRFGPALLGVLGVGALVVPLYDVYADAVLQQGKPFYSTLLENALPGVCAAVLVGAAFWFVFSKWEDEYVSTVVSWSLTVFVAAVALYVWVFGIQLFLQQDIKPYVTAADTVIAASVLGLIVGVYDARQERREAELATERDRLSSLFDSTTDCVVRIDFHEGDPLVEDVNSAFERTFGIEEAEAVGRSLDDLIVPEDDAATRARDFNERVRRGESFQAEVVRESADERREFLMRLIPLADGEEAYAVYTDITERKRLHKEVADKDRIEYLHGVVSELANAQDTGEVADVAMDAAAETLTHDYGCLVADGDLVETRGTEGMLDADAVEAAQAGGTTTVTRIDSMSVLTIPVDDRGAIQLGGPDGAFDDRDRSIGDLLGTHVAETLARLDQEREAREERERLEFMNRILRHNLLNGMNVVQARLELLEGHVDEAYADHRRTVATRVDDMIDLVETMRSFMKAIVEDEEHELRTVALDDVLESEVEKTRSAYDHVTVDVEDGYPDVAVQADDLLPELLENLLTNAVQHNDKDHPVVTVVTDVRDDEVAVIVRDNGPGVPDEEKPHVFDKGMKGLQSPGSGFGLYLVKEIVESYGGDVAVRDNEPEGAIFEVTLPRA